jgi:uncharacterized membrane protein (DUF106 family)
MANPGSPETMPAAPAPNMSKMLIPMLVLMIVSFGTLQFRMQIGQALDYVFRYITFGGQYPLLSVILVCSIAITITTIVRSLIQDPLEMARNQQIQSDFNKEMRQARIENNLFKMKKLQEMQPIMMERSMKQSSDMMKVMPISMVIFIPIIAWAWYFLSTDPTQAGVYFTPDNPPLVNLPWCGSVDLNMTPILSFPLWLILYMMVSLPVGQAVNKLIRFILLRKELERLDAEVKRAEIE